MSSPILEGLQAVVMQGLRGIYDAVEWTRRHAARVLAKAVFAALLVWAVAAVQYPLEAASWGLWLEDKQLANRIALWVVATSSIIVLMSGYAWAAKRRWLAIAGWAFAALLVLISLTSVWNRLLYDQNLARARSDASESANARTAEDSAGFAAQIVQYDSDTRERLASLALQLEAIDPKKTLARSRLLDQISAYEAARLTNRPIPLRGPVLAQVRPEVTTDPRPIDGLLGPENRGTLGALWDFLRAMALKIFILIGLPLALSPAPEIVAAAEAKKRRSEAAKRGAESRKPALIALLKGPVAEPAGGEPVD